MKSSRIVLSRFSPRLAAVQHVALIALLFTLTALCATQAVAQEPVPAQPRVYIDTTWNPPTTGATLTANSNSTFQLALTLARPGDVIILDNHVVYSGNFTLPAKGNPNHQWIYIESAGLNSLPPPGTRVGPNDAPNMAKFVTPNGIAPITIAAGASYYRLVGLEVTTASNQGCQLGHNPPVNCFSYFLINTPTATGTPLPDSITIDRSYIHGSPTQDVREGVVANGTNFAVIDSYVSDIHQSTADSQAILAYWTPGPIKIVNNFLSATTENIMFGGAGGYNNPYIPSDIEIRNNHLFKPLSWQAPGITLPPNAMWSVKDNLEFKSAQRVIATGNILENNWVSAQTGYSLLLTVRTGQSGNIAVVDDITLENNTLTNVDAGFNTLERDDQCSAQMGYPNCTNPGETRRIRIANNLVLLNPENNGAHHIGLAVSASMIDFVFQHNTVLMADQSTCFDSIYFNVQQGLLWPLLSSDTHNVWILDNALCRQPTGDWGGQGTNGLNSYMSDPQPIPPRYYGNVMFAPSGDGIASWPAHNYATAVRFTYDDPSNGDYRLQSPYWTDTTDGQEAGIDWTNSKSTSTTALVSSQNDLYNGQTATLTATVSVVGSAGPPTGTVHFMLGNTSLGIAGLTAIDGNDASATLQLLGSQLADGPNSVTAVYSGDSNYVGSTSPPVIVTLLFSDTTFGGENLGTTSPVDRIVYSFSRSAVLSAVNIVTLGTPNLDFKDGGGSTCIAGTRYTSGQMCTVAVTFSPTAPGLRSGAVVLFAQGSNLPLKMWYVSGEGESPAVAIDPGTQTTLATINNAATYGSVVDAVGNVYVADQANGQVVKIAAGTQTQTVVASQLNAPTAVTLDGAGNLYVAESTGVVMIPNENGVLNSGDMQTLHVAGLGVAQGIAIDGVGNLYIADSGNGDVFEIAQGGDSQVTVASGLTNPHAIAVDATGNVYVASDSQVSQYPVGGGTPVPMGTGYVSPLGLAVDASGTVYVADTGNGQIVKVAADGESQSVMTVAGLVSPQGVAVDSTGNLYISDGSSVYEVNRVQQSLNFGQVQVGTTSPAQTLQVSNIGNQQLNASSLTVSANYLQQPSGGSDCSSTSQLIAGGGCAIALAFSPTTTGVLNGTVTLTDNALDSPSGHQTVGLTGTGTLQQQQTITFPNPGTQTYGASPLTLTATASSGLPVSYRVVSGPATVSGSTLTITGAGSVTVEASQAGNSNWAPAQPVDDTFTVNPAVLTVTANNASMTYGGALPTLTASYSGFVDGDDQGSLTGAPALTTTATQASPAGSYPIVAAQGTLASQNYTFAFVNGTLTINPAVLTVTANNASMMYGGALPTLTASFSGFVNGDGQGSLTGAPTLTTTATPASPVGNYAIVASQGTLASRNYTFVFVNGTLTVGPAVLTVTANNATIFAGGTLPVFTASFTGFVNGDGQGVLSGAPSLTTTAPQNPPPGSYPIIAAQGTLSAQNYTFVFVNGTLTVQLAIAQITTPPKGSTFSGSRVTFGWSAQTGATSYVMYVGSTPGARDIYSLQTSSLAAVVSNLPTDGRQIYVTLYGNGGGTMIVQDTATYTAANISNGQITTPAKGSTLPGNRVTFGWSAQTGATLYALYVGSTPGARDIYSVQTSNLSAVVSNLPTDGRQIYVTLYGNGGGTMIVQDTATYNAYAYALITSPAKGSTLGGSRVTFGWSAQTGASAYVLYVGSAPGARDIYSLQTASLSAVVSNLPTDGRQIYLTLYGNGSGTMTVQDTASYTAADIIIAQITTPAKGSTLPGNRVTFGWTAETGATLYAVYVGSTPGARDIYSLQTSNLSAVVSNLPTDGRQIYVTLYGNGGGTMTVQDNASYTAATQ